MTPGAEFIRMDDSVNQSIVISALHPLGDDGLGLGPTTGQYIVRFYHIFSQDHYNFRHLLMQVLQQSIPTT